MMPRTGDRDRDPQNRGGPIGARRVCIAIVYASLAPTCASEPPTDLIGVGRQVYRSHGCPSCHEPNLFGQRLGPPLDHVGSVAGLRRPGMDAEDYLRESILDPGAYVVPGYQDTMPRGLGRDLTPTDLAGLVKYLASLR